MVIDDKYSTNKVQISLTELISSVLRQLALDEIQQIDIAPIIDQQIIDTLHPLIDARIDAMLELKKLEKIGEDEPPIRKMHIFYSEDISITDKQFIRGIEYQSSFFWVAGDDGISAEPSNDIIMELWAAPLKLTGKSPDFHLKMMIEDSTNIPIEEYEKLYNICERERFWDKGNRISQLIEQSSLNGEKK